MNRIALFSGPLGALALGGLLFLGSTAGQAQDGPSADKPDADALPPIQVMPSEPGESDQAADEPFPWPGFVEVRPLPGQYRSKTTVEDLQFPDMPEMPDFDIEGLMRASMSQTKYFCVAPDFEPEEDWLGDQMSDDCDEPQIEVDGGDFTFTTQCREANGASAELLLTGTMTETTSRLRVAVDAVDPNMGEFSMVLRMATDRVGDCD